MTGRKNRIFDWNFRGGIIECCQWVFYVVPTPTINEKLKEQKSVRISTIEGILGVKSVGYDVLGYEIKQKARAFTT